MGRIHFKLATLEEELCKMEELLAAGERNSAEVLAGLILSDLKSAMVPRPAYKNHRPVVSGESMLCGDIGVFIRACLSYLQRNNLEAAKTSLMGAQGVFRADPLYPAASAAPKSGGSEGR